MTAWKRGIVETATSSERITPSEPELVADGDGVPGVAAGPAGGARTRRSVVRRAAVVVGTVAAAIVMIDGSAGWAAVRLATVGLAGCGLLLLDRRWPVASALVGALVIAAGVGFLPT